MGFPGGSDGKEAACNVGDLGLIPRLGMVQHASQPTEKIKRSFSNKNWEINKKISMQPNPLELILYS